MYATSRGAAVPQIRRTEAQRSSGLAHIPLRCDRGGAHTALTTPPPRSGSTRASFRCSAPRQGLDVPVKHFTGAAPCVRGAEAAASYSCTAMEYLL